MIKTQFSEFVTPEALRAAKELETRIKNAVKADKLKKANEVLTKFKKEVRTEQIVPDIGAGAKQLAQDFKLYHGIK